MSGAHVFIDRSQFPENVRRDLIESLRARAFNHKFHYESYKQAAKWLALHDEFSPARTDPSCAHVYNEAFAAAASLAHSSDIHVIGLGCGGGQKEAQLLRVLHRQNRKLTYTAYDGSLPLVLTAREAALPFVAEEHCSAVVCDLGTSENLTEFFGRVEDTRVTTLFGIIPNFEPCTLFCQISRILRTDELLLLSANLAPGDDYATGVRNVLPQYDNELTRDWLMTLLLDLGFERGDGEMDFGIETDNRNLRRITCRFEMKNSRDIQVFGETISFHRAERLRLFFSYRHTLQTLRALVAEHGIEIIGQWYNDSREEGAFLCRRLAQR
jgi:L-histidine Nalpha-methyltransferase